MVAWEFRGKVDSAGKLYLIYGQPSVEVEYLSDSADAVAIVTKPCLRTLHDTVAHGGDVATP
jgi:hypothetical protein